MKTIRKQDADFTKATNADIVNHVLKSSCISKRRTTRTRKIDFYYF